MQKNTLEKDINSTHALASGQTLFPPTQNGVSFSRKKTPQMITLLLSKQTRSVSACCTKTTTVQPGVQYFKECPVPTPLPIVFLIIYFFDGSNGIIHFRSSSPFQFFKRAIAVPRDSNRLSRQNQRFGTRPRTRRGRPLSTNQRASGVSWGVGVLCTPPPFPFPPRHLCCGPHVIPRLVGVSERSWSLCCSVGACFPVGL